MKEEEQPVPGIYQHYKGNKYKVIGTARHSEDPDQKLVVYRALYTSEFGLNSLWVRPREMFLENVEVDGETVPRFRLIEPNGPDTTTAD